MATSESKVRSSAIRHLVVLAQEANRHMTKAGIQTQDGAAALLAAAYLIEARSRGMADVEALAHITILARETNQLDPAKKAH